MDVYLQLTADTLPNWRYIRSNADINESAEMEMLVLNGGQKHEKGYSTVH